MRTSYYILPHFTPGGLRVEGAVAVTNGKVFINSYGLHFACPLILSGGVTTNVGFEVYAGGMTVVSGGK